jgi:hypothetical protein
MVTPAVALQQQFLRTLEHLVLQARLGAERSTAKFTAYLGKLLAGSRSLRSSAGLAE